jgi:hypothetical protein
MRGMPIERQVRRATRVRELNQAIQRLVRS